MRRSSKPELPFERTAGEVRFLCSTEEEAGRKETTADVVSLHPVSTPKRHGPTPKPLVERFWKYVEKTATCWLWTGALDTKGYGRIGVKGRGAQRAHRIAWELLVGPIPRGAGYHGSCLMHRCDTPRCVNPAHLEVGTHRENMADMLRKGRHARRGPGSRSRLDVIRLAAPECASVEATP